MLSLATLPDTRCTHKERKTTSWQSIVRIAAIFGILLILLNIAGCESESDDGGPPQQPPPQRPPPSGDMVTIRGTVTDGRQPLENATCKFIAQNGSSPSGCNVMTDTTCDLAEGGQFTLGVLPGLQGFVRCRPPGLGNLTMSTFVSTRGIRAGQTLQEAVNPATTVVADRIDSQVIVNPRAEKLALLAAIARGEGNIAMLADAAGDLYRAMLRERIDERYSLGADEEVPDASIADVTSGDSGDASSSSEDGGGGGGGGGDDGDGADSGGAGGEAADGSEGSSIPDAVCSFALQMDTPTLGNTALVDTALGDLFDDGQVLRMDLQRIANAVRAAEEIGEAYAELFRLPKRLRAPTTEILPRNLDPFQEQFERQFRRGRFNRPVRPGEPPPPFQTVADNNAGMYFIPVPRVPGFVRCHPPGDANRMIINTVGIRTMDRVSAADVTPRTSVFSNNVIDPALNNAGTDTRAIQTSTTMLNGSVASLQITLPDSRQSGGVAEVTCPDDPTNCPDGVVGDEARDEAQLAFTAVIIFDEIQSQRVNVNFLDALNDFLNNEGQFTGDFRPLQAGVNAALDNEANEEVLNQGGELQPADIAVAMGNVEREIENLASAGTLTGRVRAAGNGSVFEIAITVRPNRDLDGNLLTSESLLTQEQCDEIAEITDDAFGNETECVDLDPPRTGRLCRVLTARNGRYMIPGITPVGPAIVIARPPADSGLMGRCVLRNVRGGTNTTVNFNLDLAPTGTPGEGN